jgi:microcystin-dependent protein
MSGTRPNRNIGALQVGTLRYDRSSLPPNGSGIVTVNQRGEIGVTNQLDLSTGTFQASAATISQLKTNDISANVINTISIVTSSITITGGSALDQLNVGGDANISGTVYAGSLKSADGLVVSAGGASITGNIAIDGAAVFSGGVTFDENVWFKKDIKILGNIEDVDVQVGEYIVMDRSLSKQVLAGGHNINHDFGTHVLDVSGTARFTKGLTVSTGGVTITAGGMVVQSGMLEVVTGGLRVNGGSTLAGTTFTGSANFQAGASITGNVNVTGAVNATSIGISGNIAIPTGNIIMTSGGITTGRLTVLNSGGADISGNMVVNGTATIGKPTGKRIAINPEGTTTIMDIYDASNNLFVSFIDDASTNRMELHGPLKFINYNGGNGSISNKNPPAIYWSDDGLPDTGINHPGNGQLSLLTAGATQMHITTSGVTVTGLLQSRGGASIAGGATITGAVDVSGSLTVRRGNLVKFGLAIDNSGAVVADGATIYGNLAVSTPGIITGFGIVPIGSITMFGGGAAPLGWLLCNGTNVSRLVYSALFGIIGTTYGGGDGVFTFTLPNFNGRSPLGVGAGTGLSTRAIGSTGGVETHTLTAGEMPAHTHGFSGSTDISGAHQHGVSISLPTSNSGSPPVPVQAQWSYGTIDNGGNTFTNPSGTGFTTVAGAHSHTFSGTSNSTGGGGAHQNMHPFLAINFIIRAF